MDIQATISKLQSDIKRNAFNIYNAELTVRCWLFEAKEFNIKYYWQRYHQSKDELAYFVKQQKINKSLYKLMCNIRNQMPYDSVIITTNEIREI